MPKGKSRMLRSIVFEICLSGAPYPAECWWRIRGANGRIISSSELMGKKNAEKIQKGVIAAIKQGRYKLIVKQVMS